ncbi:hypothetical protein HMPREF0673_02555 [Leyella stercorea DSM 18206]|uniref:Uncharacterized protein n=1 Tax=Leyella stercorea DSM 18206 TaxID=1002367 RepID=G6B0Y7_9BACT|nr:hypothetical protein HMPREF0673_02555 [Leyella stercorea DSM 18206]
MMHNAVRGWHLTNILIVLVILLINCKQNLTYSINIGAKVVIIFRLAQYLAYFM